MKINKKGMGNLFVQKRSWFSKQFFFCEEKYACQKTKLLGTNHK